MTLTRRITADSRPPRKQAVISVEQGPDHGRSVIHKGGLLSIGTQADCGLVLTDPTVSRHHLEITRTTEGYLLQDLGSTNGTYLDGVRVGRAYLREGSAITLGKTTLAIRMGDLPSAGAGEPAARFGAMVAVSSSMRSAFALLEKLALSDITILIEGETGTGKELAARGLHDASTRSSGPFVVFDCSTVPSELMESELFGHEKGAFTGATQARPGAVQEAEGGTLFLDEIGELPLQLQPKLLRFLESREFRRIGSRQTLHADVRFLAATNRDLEAQIRAGTFRQDLFFRVSAAKVSLPPLRERPEDVAILARHILDDIGRRQGSRLHLTAAAVKILKEHQWPGNAREIRNVLATATAMAGGEAIGPEHLPPLSASAGAQAGSIRDAEAQAIREALESAGGNKRRAARLLGIAPSTLYAKIRQYRI